MKALLLGAYAVCVAVIAFLVYYALTATDDWGGMSPWWLVVVWTIGFLAIVWFSRGVFRRSTP